MSRGMIACANVPVAGGGGDLGITMSDMESYGGNTGTHPATGVSWNEAARFVNWLNTSNGFSPAYKFTLQPGDAGYSPNADIELWLEGEAGHDPANRYRNRNAFYFLPGEDEWYKAGHYSGSGSTYYDYATASDTIPIPVAGGTAAGTAVYGQSVPTGPTDIDHAGGLSHYGTMGQLGNVWEWNESAFDGSNDSPSEDRVIRGGRWSADVMSLQYFNRYNVAPGVVDYRSSFGLPGFSPIGTVTAAGPTAVLIRSGTPLSSREFFRVSEEITPTR